MLSLRDGRQLTAGTGPANLGSRLGWPSPEVPCGRGRSADFTPHPKVSSAASRGPCVGQRHIPGLAMCPQHTGRRHGNGLREASLHPPLGLRTCLLLLMLMSLPTSSLSSPPPERGACVGSALIRGLRPASLHTIISVLADTVGPELMSAIAVYLHSLVCGFATFPSVLWRHKKMTAPPPPIWSVFLPALILKNIYIYLFWGE